MSLNRITYIYALLHPVSKELKYIGKTVNIKKRFKYHCYENYETRTGRWLKSIRPLKPEMLIIDECFENWQENEIFWIAYFKFLGVELTNHTLGGEGNYGFKMSEETRLKMSNSLKGKKHTDEAKAKMSITRKGRIGPMKGKKHSEEAKIGAKASGFKHSEETKQFLSKFHKGRIVSKEAREKSSITHKMIKDIKIENDIPFID